VRFHSFGYVSVYYGWGERPGLFMIETEIPFRFEPNYALPTR
jgi:hypothetical protein